MSDHKTHNIIPMCPKIKGKGKDHSDKPSSMRKDDDKTYYTMPIGYEIEISDSNSISTASTMLTNAGNLTDSASTMGKHGSDLTDQGYTMRQNGIDSIDKAMRKMAGDPNDKAYIMRKSASDRKGTALLMKVYVDVSNGKASTTRTNASAPNDQACVIGMYSIDRSGKASLMGLLHTDPNDQSTLMGPMYSSDTNDTAFLMQFNAYDENGKALLSKRYAGSPEGKASIRGIYVNKEEIEEVNNINSEFLLDYRTDSDPYLDRGFDHLTSQGNDKMNSGYFGRYVTHVGEQSFILERWYFQVNGEDPGGTLVIFHYKDKLFLPSSFFEKIKREQTSYGANMCSAPTSNKVDVILFKSKGGVLLIEVLYLIDREIAWILSKQILKFDDVKSCATLTDLMSQSKIFSALTFTPSSMFENTNIYQESDSNIFHMSYINNLNNPESISQETHFALSHKSNVPTKNTVIGNMIPHSDSNSQAIAKKEKTVKNTTISGNEIEHGQVKKPAFKIDKASYTNFNGRRKVTSRVKKSISTFHWKYYLVCDHTEEITNLCNYYFSIKECNGIVLALLRRPCVTWPSLHPYLPDKLRYLH